MKRKNTQTKDYKSIKYIQKQLLKFNDPKLTNAVTNAFNLIAKYKEPDGCLSTWLPVNIR
ncbi:unknown [Ruminococcus sp. CAG:624]|nr:unknown [Ruminococcus sp. CAG:624]